jgi:hypothetical protein
MPTPDAAAAAAAAAAKAAAVKPTTVNKTDSEDKPAPTMQTVYETTPFDI